MMIKNYFEKGEKTMNNNINVAQSAEEKAMSALVSKEMASVPDKVPAETEPVKLEVQNMAELIPTDSQCVEEIPEAIRAMAEQGYFSPTYGTAHIVNRLDGKLHAYILVDKKGSRTVMLRQQYDDGGYSAEFPIKQDDLLMVVGNANTKDSFLAKEAMTSHKRILRAYLSKCEGRETLNMTEVMRVLVEALSKLPIVSDYDAELSKQELYTRMLEVIKHGLYTERRKGYFVLTDGEISEAAQELGMSNKQLLARLKREGLLYLTESCKGYQAKVPICKDKDGAISYGWQYCLYDLEYFARLKNPEKYGSADDLATPLVFHQVRN